MRRLARSLGQSLIALLVFAVVPVAAAAGSRLDTTASGGAHRAHPPPVVTLVADAGWANRYRPGRPIPVRAVVVADTSVDATLTVTVRAANGGTTITSAPVKTTPDKPVGIEFAVASPPMSAPLPLAVVLTAPGGGVLARTAVPLAPVGTDEVVAALPGAAGASLPAEVPLSPPVGTAHLVRLDPAQLTTGALGPAGTVAATPTDLTALDPPERSALLAWVAGGGRLLVSGSGDAAIPAVPAAWQPSGPAGHQPAGLGEVWRTTVDLSAGSWTGVLRPTSTIAPDSPALFQAGFAAAGAPSASLARHTTLVFPAIAVVAAVAAGWALVIFGALWWRRRKRRPAVVWVVVLVLAAAATGGLAAARTSLARGGTVELAWRFTSPGGGPTESWLGRRTTGTGSVAMSLRSGSIAGNDTNAGFGPPGPQVTVDDPPGVPAPEGPHATVSLQGAGLASIHALGSDTGDAPLVLTAFAGAGGVLGTVENRTGTAVQDVAVFAGGGVARVGQLAPGASASWHVDAAAPAAGASLNAPIEQAAWPAAANPGGAVPPVDLAVWGAARRALGPGLLAPGTATAVGWHAARSNGGSTSNDHAASSGTAVVAEIAATPVMAVGELLAGGTIRRMLLRAAAPEANGPADAVVAFELPPGTAPPDAGLQVLVPPVMDRLAAWDGTTWIALPPPGPVDPRGAAQRVPLPASVDAEAARSGLVYLQATVDATAVGLTTSSFELRTAP